MATHSDENPNAQDVPEHQQVMSPSAATAQGEGGRGPVMNGVTAPVRGVQDLDGETRAPLEPTGGQRAGQDSGLRTARAEPTGPPATLGSEGTQARATEQPLAADDQRGRHRPQSSPSPPEVADGGPRLEGAAHG